jgi:hypothetical protein
MSASLFRILIHWTRRTPTPDMPDTGTTTVTARGRTLSEASAKATKHFKQQFPLYQITKVSEQPDPAGIFR